MTLRLSRGAEAAAEALGRSRGGLGTKIVGICDAAGRLVDFVLTPGQAHELAPSLMLLRRLPEAPDWALADMACDARAFRSAAREMGAIPVVPSRKGARQPESCPAYIYRHRNLIERCWSRLKERRAIATRYDKTAASYAAGIAIAAALDWLKSSSSMSSNANGH
ncbi:MAG: IS5 family transposase [Gaiellaceae bacterium]